MAAWGGSGLITCAAVALTATVAVVDGCSSSGNSCRVNCGSSGAMTSSVVASSSSAATASSSSAATASSSTGATSSSNSSAVAGSSSSGSSNGSGVPEGSVASQCSLPSAGYDIYVGGTPVPACPGTVLLPMSGWFSYTDVNVNDSGLDIDASALSFLYETPGCDGPNDCALHVTGSGYSMYAGVGFPLNGANTPSDAGAGYTGLQVWLKGTTTGTRDRSYAPSDNTIKVVFVTSVNRMGDEYGAYCSTQGDAGTGWVLCQMPFAGLKRDGFSSTPPIATDTFDVTTLEKIQFQPSPYTLPDGGVGTESFDFWIDDVAFY